MNTKHTPGPWEIHGKNVNEEILIGQKGKENNTGKIVKIGWNCCGKDSEEWEANAKLIAAAPELLKAAILCESITDKCNNAMLRKHVQELLKSINKTLKEAINKATN